MDANVGRIPPTQVPATGSVAPLRQRDSSAEDGRSFEQELEQRSKGDSAASKDDAAPAASRDPRPREDEDIGGGLDVLA
ncbi:MAG: hypothetical protein AAF682_08900 [Planctomycetota bacterium]